MNNLQKLNTMMKKREKLDKNIKAFQSKINKELVKNLIKKARQIAKLGDSTHNLYVEELKALLKGPVRTYNSDRGERKHTNFVNFLTENKILVDIEYVEYTGDEYDYGSSIYNVALSKGNTNEEA